jgi:hypothetical protein
MSRIISKVKNHNFSKYNKIDNFTSIYSPLQFVLTMVFLFAIKLNYAAYGTIPIVLLLFISFSKVSLPTKVNFICCDHYILHFVFYTVWKIANLYFNQPFTIAPFNYDAVQQADYICLITLVVFLHPF